MSDLSREDLMRAVPYARRYARALTGTQSSGDTLVAESLRELLAPDAAARDPRLDLYGFVTRRFNMQPQLHPKLEGLTSLQRQLLLLTALEELSVEDAAPIVATTLDEAAAQLNHGRERLRDAAATDVLIIEDETFIAMDIEALVESLGHNVIGIARTHSEALALAKQKRPGLILADIQLADGSSGLDAVNELLGSFEVPVIFITAYPERFLTGQRPEPAFLIAKPFQVAVVSAVVSQALFFGRKARQRDRKPAERQATL